VNANFGRALKIVTLTTAAVGVVGLAYLLTWNRPATMAKLSGRAPECPWSRVVRSYFDARGLKERSTVSTAEVSVDGRDQGFGIELVKSPQRSFWIKQGTDQNWSGEHLLAFLLAEHAFMGDANPDDAVRPADVVIDCGAHVGVFVQRALSRGASKVVAVEPDPANLECLRRNFREEIAAGKVDLVPKGVWNSVTTLTFSESTQNSGMNSFVMQERGTKMQLPVTTIDSIVEELRLGRVDYIKMDIEGSEREALKGARKTLARFRPRLMMDTYHRPDDPRVLPALIEEANPAYRARCGPCFEIENGRLLPHVTYFY
jgi:FkbM family methyltransferase